MIEDFGMRRVPAIFVPKLLTMEQKQLHLEITQDLLDNASSNPNFLNTMITGDESWVYRYDRQTNIVTGETSDTPKTKTKKHGRSAAMPRSC